MNRDVPRLPGLLFLAFASGCQLSELCNPGDPLSKCGIERTLISALLNSNPAGTVPPVICQNRGYCYLFWSASIFDGGPTTPPGPPGMDARCNADGSKPTTSQYKAMLAGGTRMASTSPNAGNGQGCGSLIFSLYCAEQ